MIQINAAQWRDDKDGPMQVVSGPVGEAHRRYTRMINVREGRRGHLLQGSFASFIMINSYLPAGTRYIEYNPVRAGFAKRPEDWKWISAGTHKDEKDDILVRTKPLLKIVNTPWENFLSEEKKSTGIRGTGPSPCE